MTTNTELIKDLQSNVVGNPFFLMRKAADAIEALEAEVAHVKEVEFPAKVEAAVAGWKLKCEKLEAQLAAVQQAQPEQCDHGTAWDTPCRACDDEQAQPERAPLTMEQCKAKFEAWYASAPDEEPEPDRTYELSDESMSELTKECIWLGWQAAYGIKQGGQQ